MLVRIAELEIDPEQAESYRTHLSELIATAVSTEPGVLFLFAVAIDGRLDRIRVIEGYADQAAYEAHLLTRHFLAYKSGTLDIVRSLRLFDADPISLRAKNPDIW